jgi:hypothetical protein
MLVENRTWYEIAGQDIFLKGKRMYTFGSEFSKGISISFRTDYKRTTASLGVKINSNSDVFYFNVSYRDMKMSNFSFIHEGYEDSVESKIVDIYAKNILEQTQELFNGEMGAKINFILAFVDYSTSFLEYYYRISTMNNFCNEELAIKRELINYRQ